MDFSRVLRDVAGAMEASGVRYALIGGFAMALRGVQRATADLDFILMLEDLEKVDRVLTERGYRRVFRSENVSHYQSEDWTWGRIDILHAFRRPTLGMLERAEAIEFEPGLSLRVVQTEDLIGLKVQALCNDPERAESDWLDIRLLIRAAYDAGHPLDWVLLGDYLRLFGMEDKLGVLRGENG